MPILSQPQSSKQWWSETARPQIGKAFERLRGLSSTPISLRSPLATRVGTEDRNLAEIRRLLAAGNTIDFISSFPRSGNTWLRYLLSDILLQLAGHPTSTNLPIHPDRIIPDLYGNQLADCDRRVERAGSIFKTHEPFARLERKLNVGQDFASCRHIYICRNAEDALISYYHYHRRFPQLEHHTRDGADAFCEARFADWADHIWSYLAAIAKDAPVLLVAYELMLERPCEVLAEVLSWLGIEPEAGMIERAVQNMQFSNLQAQEAQKPANPDEFFFRRGIKGSGELELQRSTLRRIRRQAAGLTRQADSLIAAQNVAAARHSRVLKASA